MNPPFVPEVMSAAVEHAEALLDASTGPMSFAIFVPAWKEVACWRQLERSRWVRGPLHVIPAREHVFSDGSQHRAASQFRPASFDTATAGPLPGRQPGCNSAHPAGSPAVNSRAPGW
ncbi:unnamed protein product [Prorocentrum cordatum]|uniref:PCIF1 WW domain-containing protein n=1 Tax=Prorocentrum cordatum TaxID=2364126 RepID=A0ABN9Y532_9DINO|nr:unnamed protein product [Polarella glacialis]